MITRFMNLEEARLIVDVLKAGSRFFKEPDLDDAGPDEGTFIHYDGMSNQFVVRRYEIGDWLIHHNGFDETLMLDEPDLLRLLTGKWAPTPTWFHIAESNDYRFDSDPPPHGDKTRASQIQKSMDIRDYACLKCEACHNHRVEPLHYSNRVNIGGANRYVHLEVKCLDCGHLTVYDFDD